MKVKNISITEIKPYKKNAKKHPMEQVKHIANSIKEFGWQQPIVIDKNGEIVIGHGRYQAALYLGLDEVPVLRADDLTEEQIKALRLADNKTNESEWDNGLLSFELNEIVDIDMSDFGFVVSEENEDSPKEEGEVPFTEELLLSHNYIVLYFDNEFDWLVAVEKFGLKQVKDLIPRKGQQTGIGRVIDGKRILEWREN